MAHIVTERCVDCRYTDCCVVCPVDCFWEVTNPAMLVIDPDVCIDCALCVPECPIQAIWPDSELPDVYSDWVDKNASLFAGGTKIKIKKDPLPAALPLAQLQAKERQKGWQVKEPSGAGEHGGEGAETEATPAAASAPSTPVSTIPTPPGVAVALDSIFQATANGIYKWRTAKSLAQQLKLAPGVIEGDLDKLVSQGHLRKMGPKTQGVTVYGAIARLN